MPKTHPRRNAREGVLQALYAQQFSEEKTTITLDRILDESPVRKKNNKFILFIPIEGTLQKSSRGVLLILGPLPIISKGLFL